MRIGIIGTRGIPNQYGGYEQFASYAAPELAERGHEVFVYTSSLHPYKESEWKGVKLVRCKDPENRIGTAGQFIYDLNCILDSRKRNFDVIIQLGYTSSSIWSFLFPSNSVIITNMDGLEWKRSKYSRPVQQYLKIAEKWAALKSDYLISDSLGIQTYLKEKYKKDSFFIAYGAEIVDNVNEQKLQQWDLEKYKYNIIIARMEPENNVETIIKGHLSSKLAPPLVIVGNYKNKFGTYLFKKYGSENIRFTGPIYDIHSLNNLRYYSYLYFHGHSVGGTNPSLLEAMASCSLVVAHNNIFNKSVLKDDAFYFTDPEQIASSSGNLKEKEHYTSMLQNNIEKIKNEYSWAHIIDKLENLLVNAAGYKK